MNYIIEINAFYEWLDTHSLSRSAVTLWYALMHINNKTHWQKSFTVAISTLQLKARLTRVELFKARAELIEAGLITCTPREKQKSARYSILPFYLDNGSPAPRFPDSNQENPIDASDKNRTNTTDASDKNQPNKIGNPNDDPVKNQSNPVGNSNENPVKNQSNLEENSNENSVKNQTNSNENPNGNSSISNENISKNDQFLNENTSKNDPDSKLNKKKLNFEQDKSCLSTCVDERQNQKDLFGKDILPTENDHPGDTPKVKSQKRMTEYDVMQLYNKICVDMTRATKLTEIRKGHIAARMKEFDDKTIHEMLQQAAKSEFLSKGFKKQWTANIDWLFRPTNFVKVLEGHYAFLRPATSNFKNFIGKPSPFEVLQEAYEGIMNHESEY